MADNHIWHFKANGTITNHIHSVKFNEIARYLNGQFLDVDGNVLDISNNDIIANDVDNVGGVPANKFYKVTDHIIDEITSTPVPVLDCITTMIHKKSYNVTILNFDPDTAYTIKFDVGVVSNISDTGVFTVTVNELPDQIDRLETKLIVYGEKEGMFRSPDAVVDIEVLPTPVVADEGLLDDDFSTYIVKSKNVNVESTKLIAVGDNGCGIEIKIDQGVDEGDWTDVKNTELTYKLKECLEIDTNNSTVSVIKGKYVDIDRELKSKDKILVTNSDNSILEVRIDEVSKESTSGIEEINMFQSSDIASSDHYGISVALSGDGLVALVGAYYEDTGGTNTGKVYTYKRDTVDDDWTEINMFQSSDIEEGDYFGASVALSSDGLVALVGAVGENTTVSNSGKVYTYKRDTIDDDWTEVNMFQSSDIGEYDWFGSGVALSSDGLVALVGAFNNDTTATAAGKVYTYKRDTIDDNWTEVNMFQSSDVEENDAFGSDVALSGDGLVALVGAYVEDTTATDAGKVYTYKRDTIDDDWTEINMFQSSDIEEGDQFGVSVALTSDGLVALVGAEREDTTASNAGKVYIYNRDTVDDDWTEVNSFQSSDAEADDHFGRSVALSGNGLVALVGANIEDTTAADAGKVYTFKLEKDNISLDITTANLDTVPSKVFYNDIVDVNIFLDNQVNFNQIGCNTYLDISQTTDETGATITLKENTLEENTMVDIDGVLAPIGSFDYDNDWLTKIGYNENQKLILEKESSTTTTYRVNEKSIDVEVNDTIVLDNEIFTKVLDVNNIDAIGENITEVNSFQSSDIEASDYFGISAALSGDGLVALVGTQNEDTNGSNAGKVYTYKRDTIDDNWTEVNMFQSSDVEEDDRFGTGVSLSSDGLLASVGAPGYNNTDGKIYTYKRDTIDDDWTEVTTINSPSDHAYFGDAVPMSSDGLVLLVGAHYYNDKDGIVYTYKRDTIDDDWVAVNHFQSSDIQNDDRFGIAAALSSDGLVALVGALSEDTTASNAGKVYTYKRDTIDDDWTEVNMFQSSDIEEGDKFGESVAISGDGLIALVGARNEDTTASDAGKVYIYKRATIDDDWTEVNMFQSSDVEEKDYFGVSVALSSDGLVALVGAHGEDTTVTNAGKVYTYKLGEYYTELTFTEQTNAPVSAYKPLSYVPYKYQIPAHILTKKPTVAYLPFKYDLEIVSSTTTNIVGKLVDVPENLILVNDKIFTDTKETTVTGIDITNKVVNIDSGYIISKLFNVENQSDTNYGHVVCVSKNGLVLLISDHKNNIVYTYKRDTIDDDWTEVNSFQSSDVEADDHFGISLALSSDGLVALVGAYFEDTTASNAGKVYTYKRSTIDDDWTEVNMFQSSDVEANDHFGSSVALSSDGLVALVGAYFEDTTASNAGKVYTYKRDTVDDDWTEVNMFQSSDIEEGDSFGVSVALSGNGLIALVGAYVEDTTASNAGKVYTYKRDTIDDNWTEVNMFQSSDIKATDKFGRSVASSSDGLTCMIGSYYSDNKYVDAGSVYLFKRDTIDDDWVEIFKLINPLQYEHELFGVTVSFIDSLEEVYASSASGTYLFKNKSYNITYDIDFDALNNAPEKVSVIDRSKSILPDTTTYDGTKFTTKYSDLHQKGREIVRKISISNKDIEVYTPFTSELSKLDS